MNLKPLMLASLFLIVSLGIAVPSALADGILFKLRVPDTNYCHLKFPAIREDTLSWSQPVLKSSNTSDIIDFYGPCDYDPTGEQAVERQSWQKFRTVIQDGE